MFKVYFTASTSFNGDLADFYKNIIDNLKRQEIGLISGQQIIDKQLLEKDKLLTKEEIFRRETELIGQADFIVAEVSRPSLGVGTEIVYALNHGKPVLALLLENYEDQISPMIAGNPSENLFLEYYNLEKIPYVLKEFINHISTVKNRTGAMIVIDGGDGSGKTTQADLLIKYLCEKKYSARLIDFPQYYSSFHGKTVAKFLRGEFGSIDQVSPYLASLAYALDRASVKPSMEDFLKKGGIIVANRYATSNMAHQGAKFDNMEERNKFLKWIYELEYKVHKIPKENIVVYLYVPWQIGMKLSNKKDYRRYLKGGNSDIHETNIQHRINSEKMYLYLSGKYRHWVKIDCVENERLLDPKTIHSKIIKVLQEKNILS